MALNEVFQSSAASLGQVVRVSIPAGFANNFDAMQKVTRSVLGKLGCEGCHSGFDIRYDVIREFVVDEKGNVNSPIAR